MKHKILNFFRVKRKVFMSGTIYLKNGNNYDFDTTYEIKKYTNNTIEYLRNQKIKKVEEEGNEKINAIVIKNFIHL